MIRFSMLAIVLCSFGCASIVRPGPDKVMITSDPPGASVAIDGFLSGVTPCEIHLDRDSSKRLTVSHEGHKTAQATLHTKVNGWIFGNLFFGWLIGIIVDLSNDNSRMHIRKPRHFVLPEGEGEFMSSGLPPKKGKSMIDIEPGEQLEASPDSIDP